MEEKLSTTTTINTTKNVRKPFLQDGEKKNKNKKRSGAFTLFKAALFMMRRRPNGKSKSIHAEAMPSKDVLTKLVGSMRPLHLQHSQSPRPLLHPTIHKSVDDVSSSSSSVDSMSRYASANNLQELDKGQEDQSPYGSSSRCATSTNLQELEKGSDSRYASALNLRELDGDGSDDEGDDDRVHDNDGDEMIDSKADEFIAQFYQQMRLQNLESVDRYNKLMARRMQSE